MMTGGDQSAADGARMEHARMELEAKGPKLRRPGDAIAEVG